MCVILLWEFNRKASRINTCDTGWKQPTRNLFASVLTVGEIRFGIELLPPSKRRDELERWLKRDLLECFERRVVPGGSIHRVSPNGKAILEKTSNQFGADLMLIEGFRNAS